MRILLLISACLLLCCQQIDAQTTAVDFTKADCNGDTFHLYSFLDSGNVAILIYEHQCGSCRTGSQNITSILNRYYPSHPLIRVIYLDNGGYSCNSTATWISTNNLAPGRIFLYSNDLSSPYGAGMPVVVICAGKGHKIILLTNSAASTDTTSVHNGIEDALGEIVNGLNVNTSKTSLELFPNPIQGNTAYLKMTNYPGGQLQVRVMNIYGQTMQVFPSMTPTGDRLVLPLEMRGYVNGFYFLHVRTTEGNLSIPFVIRR